MSLSENAVDAELDLLRRHLDIYWHGEIAMVRQGPREWRFTLDNGALLLVDLTLPEEDEDEEAEARLTYRQGDQEATAVVRAEQNRLEEAMLTMARDLKIRVDGLVSRSEHAGKKKREASDKRALQALLRRMVEQVPRSLEKSTHVDWEVARPEVRKPYGEALRAKFVLRSPSHQAEEIAVDCFLEETKVFVYAAGVDRLLRAWPERVTAAAIASVVAEAFPFVVSPQSIVARGYANEASYLGLSVRQVDRWARSSAADATEESVEQQIREEEREAEDRLGAQRDARVEAGWLAWQEQHPNAGQEEEEAAYAAIDADAEEAYRLAMDRAKQEIAARISVMRDRHEHFSDVVIRPLSELGFSPASEARIVRELQTHPLDLVEV